MNESVQLSRRRFLSMTAGFLAATPLIASACSSTMTSAPPTSATATIATPRETAPLWEHAAARGLLFGATTGYPAFTHDTPFVQAITRQAVLLTPENELKWDTVSPSLQTFDFDRADTMVNIAQQHQMLVRGHNLVWIDRYLAPGVLAQIEASPNIAQVMTTHITTEVQHYAGKMYSWDVVNEPLYASLNDIPYNLDPRVWYRALGINYFNLAFHAARMADPHALLVLNEYGFETGIGPGMDAGKRQSLMLQLLEQLLSNKVPVQVLGIEAHLDAQSILSNFNSTQYRSFLRQVAQLGLKIMITELDVSDVHITGNISTRDQAVADAYSRYLSVALDEKAVTLVNTWGLADRYTWLNSDQPRSDHSLLRPLPLDAQLQPTPAWSAMANAFDHAPLRSLTVATLPRKYNA